MRPGWKEPHSFIRIFVQLSLLCAAFVSAKLECDPTSNVKKADINNPESYLYCNLEGTFSKRKCLAGKIFNAETNECEALNQSDAPEEDPLSKPFFQAPDDLCGVGIPLTILSAPVVCNPSISSCPDGYVCRMYERTGTSYCCQGASPPSDSAMCGSDQITYFESSGRPKSCVLADGSSCPVGFGCNLIGGTTTRCCGKDFGCPYNSASFLNPNTASYVECNPKKKSSCQNGFSCSKSSSLGKYICCSSVNDEDNGSCPGGAAPLARPAQCSASTPCPTGYVCNENRCCPATGVCPVGLPLGGSSMECGEGNPCKEGYQCVTTADQQYCCPSREQVCRQPRSAGNECSTKRSPVTRYYFDEVTGSCRSFKFSQCGGNANNFNSLEECEGFCVDTQCKHGQAYRVGAVNAACAMTTTSTCPRQFTCQQPIYGPGHICCPTPELTCNEMVSAGTPCFGRELTVERYYFNPQTKKCQKFQYYGCNGNGNNFESPEQCRDFCVNVVDNVCNGAAPLMDPNQQPQRCSANVPCPAGYSCNEANYCCPSPGFACSGAMSRGNSCSNSPAKTMWHYDGALRRCVSFNYNGCGGTANRFASHKACMDMCLEDSAVGNCPQGMNAFLDRGEITPKTCTLNVVGSCPSTSSCVRSTTNQPICCTTVTSCPDNLTPYIIPGSNSVVACNIDADECPTGNECMESSSAPGFHMCCSSPNESNQRPIKQASRKNIRPVPETLAALMKGMSPCPPGLQSNGQPCTVNAIDECPSNHICFRDMGYDRGSCCQTPTPQCMQKGYIPVIIGRSQAQVCQPDVGGCSRDARCMTSSVPKLAICCKKYVPPPKPSPTPVPSARPGHRSSASRLATANGGPKCRENQTPYHHNGILQECNFVQNTCPPGYRCEFSSTGTPVCCADADSIRCPAGSSVFEYGGRPLACPPMSNKCPSGYSCVASQNPAHHLCCSNGMGGVNFQPQCSRGVAYVDPITNNRQFCSPLLDNCPSGFHCLEADAPGQFICCTQGDFNDRFRGYCPPRQIPYVSRDGVPGACHMLLNPCPTTAPYVCIYSAEKMNSYCCAPIDTAVRTIGNVAAMPMRKLGPYDGQNNWEEQQQFQQQRPQGQFGMGEMPGMTRTFPGGPMPQGPIHVAIPDPIPGVSKDKILPPGYVAPPTGNNNNNNFNGQQNFNNGNVNRFSKLPSSEGGEPIPKIIVVKQDGGFNNDKFDNVKLEGDSTGGCPLGSRPLVQAAGRVAQCAEQPCPDGFACVYAEKENRFQCCSTSSIMLAVSRPEDMTTAAPQPQIEIVTSNPQSGSASVKQEITCPSGFYLIDGKCLKVLFAGQKGCISNSQCAAREANATCDSGYCICPASKPLVHGGRCISSCPEGFANIAGRCYDPTTVIFMDSVDERANGTIGGYCLDTLVEEKRCSVEKSYCSERTVTCQCHPGYDLKMDFDNKNDKGACVKNESSKFVNAPAKPQEISEELYFIDIGPSKPIERDDNSTVLNDDDLSKYLFQSDELIPVFA